MTYFTVEILLALYVKKMVAIYLFPRTELMITVEKHKREQSADIPNVL